jgi:hypothetical protein
MLEALIAILCGLILAARLIPALKGAARVLDPVGGILGVIAFVLGLLGVLAALGIFSSGLGGFPLLALTLLLAGFILGARLIPAFSGLKNSLDPVGGIIGLFAVVLGIIALL